MKRLQDNIERMAREAYFINNNIMELKKEYKGVLPNNLSAVNQAATITY